jgi:hypothetical protein
MKKYLKLLLVLSITLATGVNAKTYQFYGGHIDSDVYKSGDTFTNFITYEPEIIFSTPTSDLTFYEDGELELDGEDIFDIKGDNYDSLVVPKMYGKNVYWQYYSDDYENDWYGIDIFKPVIIEPEYIVECDKDYVDYGEQATCTLKSKAIKYTRDVMAYMQLINFNSEDFDIDNIETLNYWKLDSKTNKYYFDINQFDRDFDRVGYDLMNTTIGFTNSAVELDKNGNITSKQPATYERYFDDEKHPDTFLEEWDVLKFTINPKVAGLDIRNIKLQSSMNTGNLETPVQTKTVSIAAPKKEEVKGVEEVVENPNTGIFNYLLLIVPILLFLLGYKLVLNKNIFKFNK